MTADWFDRNGSGNLVDVHEVLDGLAVQGVLELIESGALVSLGTTSDGGALGMTVTVDGRWRREYFRTSDELKNWIAEALPAVQEATSGRPRRQQQPASSVRGPRTRGRKGP